MGTFLRHAASFLIVFLALFAMAVAGGIESGELLP